jgi:hypothetical protein
MPFGDENYCSPLGLVPKKDPSNFCMIHHLSHPKGQPVNDCIPTELSSVQYTRIQDAILGIKQSPCFMAKCDIELPDMQYSGDHKEREFLPKSPFFCVKILRPN